MSVWTELSMDDSVMSRDVDPQVPGTNGFGRAMVGELELDLWSRYIDKLTASIIAEFEAQGIVSILLKGPAIARWLYGDGSLRPYTDADLLISPEDWERAESLLEQLGFERDLAPLDHPGMESFASEAWVRGADNIDLHCTLWGMGASPERVWGALSKVTDSIVLEDRTVRVLALPGRALLLATHAAKHGDGQPVGDLVRAVDRLPLSLWRQAAELATELDAAAAFSAGMRLAPGGREIVQQVGLLDVPLAEASLRAWRVPMALGLEQLSRTPGLASKLAVLWRELFPTTAFMRWWTPLARRGSAGLALAYIWRLLWVIRYAIPALRAWRSARRGTDRPPPSLRRGRRRAFKRF